jgi:hypothetical protein
LTGYQDKIKIFLSISEIVKMKGKIVNYFLVCNNNGDCHILDPERISLNSKEEKN